MSLLSDSVQFHRGPLLVPAAGTDMVRASLQAFEVAEELAKHDSVAQYRAYYDGDHDTLITERLRRFLELQAGQEFNANYCALVVDARAERLTVTGFDAGDEQSETLWEWWTANRMDATQADVHTSAVRDGDAYIVTEWDDEKGRPVFSLEMAWVGGMGGEGVRVFYNPNKRSEIFFAAKQWIVSAPGSEGKTYRLNLYFDNRVEKYIRHGNNHGGWQAFIEEDGLIIGPGQMGQAGLQWWTEDGRESGMPLGVPVAHFAYHSQGFQHGRSILADVIPLQNALNKTLIDVMAIADHAGFGIYYMLGDDPSQLKLAPGGWIHSPRPPTGEEGVAVGKIEADDPEKLIRLKDSIAADVARVTRTPLSFFQISGQRAAEGTLKQEEAGLVSDVRKTSVNFGNAWEDAMSMARKLANAFGGQALDTEQQINTVWADPETRNEKEKLETLTLKKALGVPDDQLWREMGYDDEKIREFQRRARRMEADALRNQLRMTAQQQAEEPPNGTDDTSTGAPPAVRPGTARSGGPAGPGAGG